MTIPRSQAEDSSLGSDLLQAVRYYLGRRRSILVLAVVALVAGLAFNWSWLVAAGVAPLLVTALPCVVMCALGLCMNRVTGRACSSEQAVNANTSSTEPAVPEDHTAGMPEASGPEHSVPQPQPTTKRNENNA